MKCQILFSGKIKKTISKCHLLKIVPRVLNVKTTSDLYLLCAVKQVIDLEKMRCLLRLLNLYHCLG